MSSFECSSQQLRNAATNAGTIENAIMVNPLHRVHGGDLGHAGVSAALEAFRASWSGEFRLRGSAAQQAAQLLRGAAADTDRVDALLAQAVSRLGAGR